jgi:hypothetical protein
MPTTLATAREYLERAQEEARSRADHFLIGERICELLERRSARRRRADAGARGA